MIMKVICIDSKGIEHWLTKKVKYEVIKETEHSYYVIDNTGVLAKYSKSRFGKI